MYKEYVQIYIYVHEYIYTYTYMSTCIKHSLKADGSRFPVSSGVPDRKPAKFSDFGLRASSLHVFDSWGRVSG